MQTLSFVGQSGQAHQHIEWRRQMAKEMQQPQLQQAGKPKHKGGWQTKLAVINRGNNAMKASGRGSTSFKTREERDARLFGCFHTLHKLGYGIEDPSNLRPRHIEALVKEWTGKNLKPSTIANYLSFLATFCQWIGKPGMVKSLHEYAPEYEKRKHAATKDKSFEGNGVDFWVVFDEVFAYDQYVGMQLLAQYAFGMRRKEVVMFQPIVMDAGNYVRVVSGSKGGRKRQNGVDQDFKRAALTALKNFVVAKKGLANGHIGKPDRSLEQNLKRYNYVLSACGVTKEGKYGVTAHGLRTQFVIDELIRRNLVPTVRGGSGKVEQAGGPVMTETTGEGKTAAPLLARALIKDAPPAIANPVTRALVSESGQVVDLAMQIPAGLESRVLTDQAYLQVSEETGHSRRSVMTAYSGPLRPPKLPVASKTDADET